MSACECDRHDDGRRIAVRATPCEAARTGADALRYHRAYADAISTIAAQAKGDVRSSPGISVKLSALHPRYETTHRATVMTELVPRAIELARMAAKARIGFNIDAE